MRLWGALVTLGCLDEANPVPRFEQCGASRTDEPSKTPQSHSLRATQTLSLCSSEGIETPLRGAALPGYLLPARSLCFSPVAPPRPRPFAVPSIPSPLHRRPPAPALWRPPETRVPAPGWRARKRGHAWSGHHFSGAHRFECGA